MRLIFMFMQKFKNKKIGIWGFGKVGASYLSLLQNYASSITILDKKNTQEGFANHIQFRMQTPEEIASLFENNEYIFISPGINISAYEMYKEKCVTELDIFPHLWKKETIAITGSLGKTTITSLSAQILQNYGLHAQAIGNIGYPMLEFAQQRNNTDIAVVELSSFQLSHAKNFTPDIAIWTNLYENHLDYHHSFNEYAQAKKNICSHQTESQTAIIHADLFSYIKNPHQKIHWICNNQKQALDLTLQYDTHSFWYIDEEKNITHLHKNISTSFCNLNNLSSITFPENWLIISAMLHVKNLNVTSLPDHIHEIILPEHRLHIVATAGNKTFYNDSKSTVWQATYKALQTLQNQKTIIFFGGTSKGVDRAPFFELLDPKMHTIYAFGKEAEEIQKNSSQHNILCKTFSTLDEAFARCIQETFACNILFSPGGASYDLFQNFQHRGTSFETLVKNYQDMIEKKA